MVHGRIETTPAEQMRELRKARDRYAALAEKLHDSADPELDPEKKLALELDARRILQAYEKSIANSEVRLSSMGKTHRFAGRPLGVRTWLAIFMVISAIEGGLLLAYFRPALLAPLTQLLAAKSARAPSVPVAALPRPVLQTPPPVPEPGAEQNAPLPKPIARPERPPLAATPRPAAPPPPTFAATPRPVAPPPTIAAAPRPVAPPPTFAAPRPLPALNPILPPQAPPPVAAATPTPPPVAAAAPPLLPQPQAVQQLPPLAVAAIPPPTRLEPIAGTHTPPPYPFESKRLGEAGTTQMRLAISAQGAATDCTIARSSGSERLDAAACDYVRGRWRWKPATQGGQPVATITQVTIVWNLKAAP